MFQKDFNLKEILKNYLADAKILDDADISMMKAKDTSLGHKILPGDKLCFIHVANRNAEEINIDMVTAIEREFDYYEKNYYLETENRTFVLWPKRLVNFELDD